MLSPVTALLMSNGIFVTLFIVRNMSYLSIKAGTCMLHVCNQYNKQMFEINVCCLI